MTAPLEKSYVNNYNPLHPVREDVILYQLFREARDQGHVGEIVNLENDERISTTDLMDKADLLAKGLLALGLTPGEDVVVAMGVPTTKAMALFVASCSIGIGYAHTYIYTPKEESISSILPLVQSKFILVGEATEGTTFDALMTMFDGSDSDTLVSSKLPFVENIFYDNSYNERDLVEHKFVKHLDKLVEIGNSISDEQLDAAKQNVRSDFVLHHLFTSGSTGQPKCVAHTHKSLANELLQLRAKDLSPVLTMNHNVDEMISYACIAWTLAGRFSKVVIAPEVYEDRPAHIVAKKCTEAIAKEKVEYLLLPGGMQQIIAAYIRDNDINIHPMKMFLNGAQVVSRGFKEGLRNTFKGFPLTAYGMCETFILAHTRIDTSDQGIEAMMEARLYPKMNCEMRLVDENNEVVDIGKDGEIQVKTYSVLKEYKRQKEKTRDLYTEDGFLRTGDMGVMSPDGTFVIKGRAADAIRFKVFGDVIYPGPIEEVLSLHPDIKDCSVVSGNSNDWIGDEITYCISLEEGVEALDDKKLTEFCNDHRLDESHRAARIIYFEKFPTTPNSRKVSKVKLRQQVRDILLKEPDHGKTEYLRDFEKLMSLKQSD